MSYFILFVVPILCGLGIFIIPKERLGNYKLLLVFAGSYLFAITVTHILPEIYQTGHQIELVGIFVLAGFFLQQVLEYFTVGVEHGHLAGSHEGHHHHHIPVVSLLVALSFHAFLEGGMLAHPESSEIYNTDFVMLGILFHKGPAAFALMSLVLVEVKSKIKGLIFLLLFAVAAPLGLLVANYLIGNHFFNGSVLVFIYALVCGNFLHISTTIVFESSPGHKFNGKKFFVGVLGAFTGVGLEIIFN